MTAQMKAWSYSRWRDYDQCPLKAKFKYIDKIPEPGNAAMENGERVHKTIAAYVRGDLPWNDPIPGWTYFSDLFRQLRELSPAVEQEWGFNDRWGATGWFGNDVWFRAKLDAAIIYADEDEADVIDYKTGRARLAEAAQQAELYFLAVFKRYPHVKRVTVRFWFVDTNVNMNNADRELVFRFSSDMAPALLKRWTERARQMLNDPHYAPNPGQHCKWCYQAKSKGGACRYG